MILSFNGHYRPYTYNCPAAFKFRAIDKIYPPKPEEIPEEPSARREGIVRHEDVAGIFTGIMSGTVFPQEIEHEWFVEDDLLYGLVDTLAVEVPDRRVYVEESFYVDLDYNPLSARPSQGHAMSAKPDLIIIEDGRLTIYDWKFGNSYFGASVHYREVEWFLAVLQPHFLDVGEFVVKIHFPNDHYTLPERVLNSVQVGGLQREFSRFATEVTTRKIFFPEPARSRCRLCDYRAEENGGIGNCEDAILRP